MEKAKKVILSALWREPHSFWELIGKQDRHLAQFTRIIKEMKEEGMVEWGERLSLTEAGEKLAREMRLQEREEVGCPRCQGKGVVGDGLFNRVYKKMEAIKSERPGAIAQFDQGPVDLDTLVARLMVMYQRGDLERSSLLVLGDDDLTGIAAALTGLPEKVLVMEVDERLVEFIQSTARKEGLDNLETRVYDVREPLPKEVKAQFDTFFVDPVETVKGITLFLNRCVMSLRGEGCAGYFGLTHLEASRKKWHLLQNRFLQMNMVITDIERNFQWYELGSETFVQHDYPLVKEAPGKLPAPQLNWYSSDLYRLEAVSNPQEVSLEIPEGRELYFDDESFATLP